MPDNHSDNDKTRSFVALTAGAEIAHYKIISKIGSGGMGDVFLGEDTRLKRQVALKFLPVHFSNDQAFKTRFLREARAAAKLNHPNIVTIYEIAEIDTRAYIAMEHINGKTLQEIIESDKLPVDKAIDFTLQICYGLAEAHKQGIIHRDIKPANILLDTDNRIRILDFGLAKAEGDTQLTHAGTVLGTANYMSPEQGQGLDVDHRGDIFSVGVIFQEMLTGYAPFKRSNLAATIHAIVSEPPELISKYTTDNTDELQMIIDKSLAKEPAKRYQSVDELINDLKKVQAEKISFQLSGLRTDVVRPKVKSLAVLYLRNLGSPDDEFLSYGITEDLIIDLTRIGTIRVTPMRSILKYKNSDEDLIEIARQLNVSIVLDGSIHKSGNSLRVAAQLMDVTTGENLWADRWEESSDFLPQTKQALADGISRALNLDASVVREAQVGTPEAQNVKAYELYLRGKYSFDIKEDTSDVEVALGLYRQALVLEPTLLACRAGIAEILLHQGEYEETDKELQAALADARERKLAADEATLLLLLTQSHTEQSRWDEAWDYGSQTLEITKKLKNIAGEAEVLGALIDILLRRAKFDEALELFDRVLEINRQLNNQQKAAEALKYMGVVHTRKGEYDRARALYSEALKIARQRKDSSLEAACLGDIGVAFLLMGDIDKAFPYFEQALQIDSQLGNLAGKATWFNNIAVFHYLRGDYRKAIESLEKAASIKKQLGDRGEYALYHNNVAQSLIIIGEYDRAITISLESLTIGKELNYPLVIFDANDTLGQAHFCKGKNAQAKEYYQAALDVAGQAGLRKNTASVFSNMGEMHYLLKEYDKCHVYSEKALTVAREINEKEAQFKASAYIAALKIRNREFTSGVEQLHQIVDEAKKHEDPRYILIAQRLLGEALYLHSSSDSSKSEGKTILDEAMALAKEKEVAYEIKWIGDILK